MTSLEGSEIQASELITALEINGPPVSEKLARLLVDYDMDVIIDLFRWGKKVKGPRPVEDGLGSGVVVKAVTATTMTLPPLVTAATMTTVPTMVTAATMTAAPPAMTAAATMMVAPPATAEAATMTVEDAPAVIY